MDNKINYRNRDGRRLTIAEYKKRRQKEIIFHLSLVGICIILIIGSIVSISIKLHKNKKRAEEMAAESVPETPVVQIVDTKVDEPEPEVEEETNPFMEASEDAASFFAGYTANITDDVSYISSENVLSNYAILLNLDTGNVVANKDGTERINPASMTKILTLLVAAENLTNLDDTFEMTQAIGDFVYKNDCSAVGFSVGETVSVRDMLYGTILPSGGDAAMCLAEYIAGSQEAFVDMMNDKLKELGLSDTAHFTNCIGIYNEDHYCTLLDMAMILKAAEENSLCHEVLNARTYTTSNTEEHPEGITVSNWFMRRIEDKDTHGEVMGAKTGFVNQSGCCGASYQISNDGTHYICVTADAWSTWRCIYDHVEIYDVYTS
ncbi:MAG: D-alanyl-D-alanine carboxypeptidase [Butyrivibrio sp.]|nr:D-alanyl-D-alanine carboxypeptidase [Butyrivibrio sp.]